MTYKNRPITNIVGAGALGQALRPMIPVDLPVVFFCVKAFDLAAALLEHATLWPDDVPFVTLCNGFVGSEIARSAGTRTVRWGMTTIGAKVEGDGTLSVFKDGSITSWGPFQNGMSLTSAEKQIIEFNEGWSWQNDMTPIVRRKWIFNTVLNTLCGALRLSSNGQLSRHRGLADALFDEAWHLAKELWPDRANDLEPIEIIRAQFWDLVQKTSGNENSMARDVRLGRRNESAFLAGMAIGRRGYDRLKTYHTVLG